VEHAARSVRRVARRENRTEAKADIDVLYDKSDVLNTWIKSENNPAIQMRTQADKALGDGRLVVWPAHISRRN
jgi:hypothetical protein